LRIISKPIRGGARSSRSRPQDDLITIEDLVSSAVEEHRAPKIAKIAIGIL